MPAGVTIVDYGVGNVRAFVNIFERLNVPVDRATTPEMVRRAHRLILPGVGAFDWAMTRLNASGMRQALDEAVQQRQVPVLGVCVGFQMMARGSEEGRLPGLAWLQAEVARLPDVVEEHRQPLPHMGWNDASPVGRSDLFAGMNTPRFYFLHTYHVVLDDPGTALAWARYGIDVVAAAGHGHIVGTQFHPEKSHHWGVDLLANFAR